MQHIALGCQLLIANLSFSPHFNAKPLAGYLLQEQSLATWGYVSGLGSSFNICNRPRSLNSMPCNPIAKQVKNDSTLLQCQSKACMSHTTSPNTIFTLSQMPEKRLGLESAHRPSSGTSQAHFQLPSFLQHSLQCFNLHPLSEAPLRPPLRAPPEHFMSGWVGNYLASLIFPLCRCECQWPGFNSTDIRLVNEYLEWSGSFFILSFPYIYNFTIYSKRKCFVFIQIYF